MDEDLTKAIGLILPRWRKEFADLLDSGDACPEFLQYLDENSDAQQAFELAMTRIEMPLRELIDVVKELETSGASN